MSFLIYTLHVLICFFLIAVVLLQQGKGADLSVFGGGGTQTAFGARGAATVLHKLTVGSFIGFILTTLLIGVLQTEEQGGEVFSGLPEAAASADADEVEEPAEPAGALPADTDPAVEVDATTTRDGELVDDEGTLTDDGAVIEDATEEEVVPVDPEDVGESSSDG